jgi:hypothetical protein
MLAAARVDEDDDVDALARTRDPPPLAAARAARRATEIAMVRAKPRAVCRGGRAAWE